MAQDNAKAVVGAACAASATTLAVVWLINRRHQRGDTATPSNEPKQPPPQRGDTATPSNEPKQPPPQPPPQQASSPAEVLLSREGDSSSLLSICRLRWIVYVGELKRQNYAYVDNVRHILEDPLDHESGVANFFIEQPEQDRGDQEDFITQHMHDTDSACSPTVTAFAQTFVPSVGCVRIHVPCPQKYAALFSLGDANVWGQHFASRPGAFAFFSRFMVHARYRGKKYGFADRLYEAAAQAARESGARFLLLNCTPALAPLYEARGFVRYKPAEWDDAMGLQVPMALVLDDLAFLELHDPKGPITAAVRKMSMAAHSGAPEGFPDVVACRWLSRLLDTRPHVLTSSRCYTIEMLRRFVDARGIEFDKMPLFRGVSAADRAELLARCPNALFVLDLPTAKEGVLISRVGDVRDESFLVLRGVADVDDGIETLGPGAVVGETSFLSGDKRACSVRILASTDAGAADAGAARHRAVEAEGGALVLVTSRVGFQKAMAEVPSIAVRLLWNLATEFSRKFSLRNELLKQHAAELEAKRHALSKAAIDAERKERRAGEMQELRDAAVRLRKIVAGRQGSMAPPATRGVQPAASQPRWKQSFDEGLLVWQRLEQQYATALQAAGTQGDASGTTEKVVGRDLSVGGPHAIGGQQPRPGACVSTSRNTSHVKGVRSSATTPQLPSQQSRPD